jgi:hypothetical protein
MRDTAGMSSAADTHAEDAHHVGGGHEHEHAPGHDEHGDHSEPLGPVDTAAWAAAIGGSVVGLLVAAAFYLSITAA